MNLKSFGSTAGLVPNPARSQVAIPLNKSNMISMPELTYVVLYLWRGGGGCKKSTASIEASFAEELVNKSSTVRVLESG